MGMSNKIQTVTAVSTIGFGGLGLLFMCRKRFSHFIWSLRTKNFFKRNKKIFIVNDNQKWEEISEVFCRDITAINALGFDCEWVQKSGKRQPVALMQLATYSGACALIRLNCFKGNIPLSLKEILENGNIVKVGVSPDSDVRNLAQDYDITINGWVDLRHLAIEHQVMKAENDVMASGEGLGLQTLAKKYLGKDLDKHWRVSTSNWEAPELSARQINYAAEDALVGIQILLAILKMSWAPNTSWPPFRLQNWESTTSGAIKIICSPIVEMRFNQNKRHLVDSNCAFKKHDDMTLPQTKIVKELRSSYCTRKSPLYHNSQLWAPDGEPLCTCDPKKALWYVEKDLGELVSENPLVVKLKFEPAGRPNREGVDGMFYLQERQNLCVVCGKDESYIRKNIIPHEYRKYFPRILKSHQSHDVVLLCTGCHQMSNIKDSTLRHTLAADFNAPIGCETDVKLTIDGRLKAIRSAGGALKKSRGKLPPVRVTQLENILKDFFDTESLTDEHIRQAAELDTQIMNASYIPHGIKVYQAYKRIGLIRLEERWRQWFLNSMQPKYLPDNWSVSHNHTKLRLKMSRYSLDDKIRDDYKTALVGTEGVIDVPHVPTCQRKLTSNFFGLGSSAEEEEDEFSRENTPEEN